MASNMASKASTSKIIEDVIIEEVDSSTLNEEELRTFVPADIHNLPSGGKHQVQTNEEEGELIRQLVNGELTFSEYSARMGRNSEDIEAEEEEERAPEDFEKELIRSRREAFRGQLGGTVQKYKRRKCILPPALQGLMGEANLCYARGDNELAKKVCLEIIRQVPLAAEPFLTLAQIYEATDLEKCMQFMLIAGYLNPGDTHHWIRLSEMSEEVGNMKQAVFCLSRALKHDPRNMEVRMKRIELLEKMGEERFALHCYFTMIPYIPAEQGEYLLSVAKKVAHKFHQENNGQKALEAMRKAYEKIPELFSTADLNLLLELLIMAERYEKVIEILANHTEVRASVANGEVLSCFIPENLIIDFRTKLAVSLIRLRAQPFIDTVISNILLYVNVEVDGDCVLEVAEALMMMNEYAKALQLLNPLVESQNFSYAEVWLRHGDCQRALEHFDEAIRSYREVVNLAPTHLDARLTLSALLKLKNQPQEALKALEQDLETDLIDPKLLYERCFMLRETGNLDLFVDLSYILFSRHCVKYRTREEVETAASVHVFAQKINSIKDLRQVRLENLDDDYGPEFTKSTEEPTLEEEWTLFRDVVQTCYESGRFDIMEKITVGGLTSKRLQGHIRDIEFMALIACLYNRDSLMAYFIVKEFLMKNLKEPRVWNLFNLIINNSDEVRASRFLQRMLNHHGNDLDSRTHVLRANYWLASGTYKYALNDYMSLYTKMRNPVYAFLVGVTYLQLGSQKFGHRPNYLKQGIAFMDEYMRTREKEAAHEVSYNLGRFYHQIGMLHIATSYYKQVLDYTNSIIEEHPEIVDLKRAAAYNLHLIYRESRNYDLARYYLYNYIVV
ncbi:general transcription factor 3C polypeptide 3 [Lutzomyia longipalpis]|uniref:general transcription factor 3C polypeptide 3 n=1 Tax=Lutzomyia longipalpis TaxID=7200 RepID=UPI00248335F4|nr:general transcription factor 3C polypeptide 3 [Lutzomyia longipalpis]